MRPDFYINARSRRSAMYVNPHAILSIFAGILILVRPVWLNYIIAIYLIVTGILALTSFPAN